MHMRRGILMGQHPRMQPPFVWPCACYSAGAYLERCTMWPSENWTLLPWKHSIFCYCLNLNTSTSSSFIYWCCGSLMPLFGPKTLSSHPFWCLGSLKYLIYGKKNLIYNLKVVWHLQNICIRIVKIWKQHFLPSYLQQIFHPSEFTPAIASVLSRD